jgi:hypothetical protein
MAELLEKIVEIKKNLCIFKNVVTLYILIEIIFMKYFNLIFFNFSII